jgi:hypothetical protein
VKPRREGRVLGALLALCLSGCTTVVVPPARVAEPARVALLDHGRHASLVLKTAESGMVRYAYGDWDWYAQGTTGAIEGSAAVLWPTRAALGRRRLPGPVSPAAVTRQVRAPIEDALYLTVAAPDARRLIDLLDRIFEENRATRIYNEASDLYFVRHPEPYWILHNSNQMVGDWLEQLGCRVQGLVVLSNWEGASGQIARSEARSSDAGRDRPVRQTAIAPAQ